MTAPPAPSPHSIAVQITEAVTLPDYPELAAFAQAYLDLEEQLEASRRIVDAARVVIEKEGLRGHEDDEQFWRTKKPYWIAELRRAVLYPASNPDASNRE